jgi:antitoxin-like ribbon-helix-helix protein
MKATLKSLAEDSAKTVAPSGRTIERPTKPVQDLPSYRIAQTRADTRQVSGHFKPEVAQTLRLIAAEQGLDIQEILAQGLNLVFTRYGKAVRAEVSSGRRKKG